MQHLKILAFTSAIARHKLAMRIAEPVDEALGLKKGYRYVRLDDSLRPTRAETERGALRESFGQFVDDEKSMPENFIDNRLATTDKETAERWQEEGAGIGQISNGDYNTIFGDFRGSNHMMIRALDHATDFWRTLTLTYRPAWVVNNFIGQTFLYAMNHSTPGGAKAYARAALHQVRGRDTLTPELQGGFIRSESHLAKKKMGATSRTGRAAQGVVNAEHGLREWITKVNAISSDNIPREAAYRATAASHLKRMKDTNVKLDDFLEQLRATRTDPSADPKLAKLHAEITQDVLDQLIDFGDLSHFERTAIRRVVPFYSWIKGILKASGHLLLHSPQKLLILYLLASQGEKVNEDIFGPGASIVEGFAPIGKAKGDVQGGLSTTGLNPFATVGQTIGETKGFFEGNAAPADNIFLQTNPWVQALATVITKSDPFSGQQLAGSRARILVHELATAFPQAQLGEKLVNSGDTGKNLTVPKREDMILSYLGLPTKHKRISVSHSIAAKAAARK